MANVHEVVARLKAEGASQYSSDVSEAAEQTESVGDAAEDTEERTSSAWGGMATAIGAATTAAGGAIEAFNRSQQETREGAGRTARAVGVAQDEIMGAAASMNNATRDVDELVAMMETGSQRGIESVSGLQEFAAVWDTVGDATGENAAQLAEQSVALEAVGISARDPQEAMAAFGFITESTTAGVGEFMRFVERAGKELGDAAPSVNEMAALLGAMEDKGLGAQQAQREVQQALRQSEGDMAAAREELGISNQAMADYESQVESSSGVIDENAKAFEESRTTLQRLQSSVETVMTRYSGLASAAEALAPVLMGGGIAMMGATHAFRGGMAAARGLAAAVRAVRGIQLAATAQTVALTTVSYAKAVAFGVATAATWALNTALAVLTSPITLVVGALAGLVAIGYVVYRNWDTITTFFRERFEALPDPIQGAISRIVSPIRWLVRVGQWMKDNWSDIWNVIRQTFGIAADVLTGNMEGLTNRLGSIWSSIKAMFAAPINWVIENVWNNGIRKAWNRVADLLPGLKAMREIGTIASGAERVSHAGARGVGGGLRRQTGGPIPGQGTGDRVPLWGEPGEWVINRDVSSREGDVAMAMLNSGRARIVGADTPELGQGPGRGGGGRGSLDMLADLMGRSGIPHRLTSGYRPGDPGHHGDRNAADFAGPTRSSVPTPAMNRIFDFWAQYAGNLKELIYAGADRNVKNGRWVSPYAVAQHRNHVHVAALASQLAGGKAAAGGGAGGIIGWLRDRVAGVMDRILGPVKNLIGDHLGTEGFPGMLGRVGTGLIDKVIDFVRSSAEEADASGMGGPGGAGGALRAELLPTMRRIAEDRGWPSSHVAAWDELIKRESSWNPAAQNPVSTAAGLHQFLDSTAAQYGGRTSNPLSQIWQMARYIDDRYGNPLAALGFHNRNNYYARGGRPIPRVPSIVGEDGPELWVPDAGNRGTIHPGGEGTTAPVNVTINIDGDVLDSRDYFARNAKPVVDAVSDEVQSRLARR